MIDGVLLANKPSGISSTKITGFIKSIYPTCRVGHCGTLDLEASGLLVIIIGKATRLERFLHMNEKSYQGEITLGIETSTDDTSGEVLNSGTVPALSVEDLESLKIKFTGTYDQLPPKVSAKKVDGKIAYKEARKGNFIELSTKKVTATVNNLIALDSHTLQYELTVSSGYYIRSFARDLGSEIGSYGCTKSIIRTKIGPYSTKDENCIEFNNFNYTKEEIENNLISLTTVCSSIPIEKLTITEDIAEMISKGHKKILESLSLKDGYTLLIRQDESPVAIISNRYDLATEKIELKYECVF